VQFVFDAENRVTRMNKTPHFTLFWLCLCCLLGMPVVSLSQTSMMKYDSVGQYEIGGLDIKGVYYSDPNAIKSVSGLQVGQKIKIPGNAITKAMRNLWKLRLFDNVQILENRREGDIVYLTIGLTEKSRLAGWSYRGVPQSVHDDLNDIVEPFLIKGQVASEAMEINAKNAIRKFYVKRGYYDAEVNVREETSGEKTNAVNLIFDIDTKDRIKIDNIYFVGNNEVSTDRLKKMLKDTKMKSNLLKKSKLVEGDYEQGKQAVIKYYRTLGYRDARITGDSIWRNQEGLLELKVFIDEGDKYYFGIINWKGNTLHSNEELNRILGIRKGEIYNEELLDKRLRFSLDGRDVSSIYMDDGYLFFSVEPTEVAVHNDTIDLEMRMFEGPQATINQVIIKGNTRTHEHVIRRELRTQPGQKFSRADIIRSQRQIIALGYFNPENLGISTPVDQTNGTVDIIYTVEEHPSDQLELSAGWGGFGKSKIIGTLGVTFNNFSLRNIFNSEAWSPLPQGDGQRLSLRAQTNGDFYQSYNFSFTEPWLGGKKPNAFTVGGVLTKINQDYYGLGRLNIGRAYVGLGTRLKWPDDNFISNTTLTLEDLTLYNYSSGDFVDQNGRPITNGRYHNYSIQETLARSTVSEPNFPRSGAEFSLTVQLTPPYTTLFGRKFNPLDPESTYEYVEYHKWRFNATWYSPISGKLVLMLRAKMGYLGYYNKNIGAAPFERYEVGGDGLSNQQFGLTGKDIISMRGYEVADLPANARGGATIFNKFTAEIRYPLSLNPSSTIYALLFAEGGNAWKSFDNYNPFDLRRSAGFGVRAFLPMFGLLGFDFGYGWDNPTLIDARARWSKFGNFNIVLGFEPD
jgi:outer membrane protein insertion porin family